MKLLLATLLTWAILLGTVVLPASARCSTKACDKRVHAKRVWNVCVRRHGGQFCTWRNRYRRLPGAAHGWTRCVSAAESGNRRVAPESGHLSYFQWTAHTWWATGAKTHPYDASWYEQAVRAWRWHRSHPVGQWPNTGEGGRCGS